VLRIKSKFLIGTNYEYSVKRSETFNYLGSEGKSFKNEYKFVLKKVNQNQYEAYYPSTIFSQIKELDDIKEYLRSNDKLKTKTLYFSLSTKSNIIEIDNLSELKSSSKEDCLRLKDKLTNDQFVELDFWANRSFESFEKVEEYLLKDVSNLFYCENLEVDENYHIDFTTEDGIASKLAKRVLKVLDINLDECSILKFRNLDSTFELTSLSSKNALTAINENYKGIDFKTLKENFIHDILNFAELKNGTYALHKYHILKDEHILNEYENIFKIDSSKMKKKINYKLRRNDST